MTLQVRGTLEVRMAKGRWWRGSKAARRRVGEGQVVEVVGELLGGRLLVVEVDGERYTVPASEVDVEGEGRVERGEGSVGDDG